MSRTKYNYYIIFKVSLDFQCFKLGIIVIIL